MNRLALCLLMIQVVALACQAQSLQADLQRAQKRSLAETESNREVDKLVSEVAKLQQSGDLQAALDRCDRAAAIAYKADAIGRAFELSLVGAELARQQGDRVNAADRFERAAVSSSNDPRAVEAHYQAILLLSEQFDIANHSDEFGERLDKALAEHTRQWPRSKYASETVWRRIELLTKRKRWQPLIKSLKQVAKNDARFERAQQLLIEAHQNQFNEAIRSQATASERKQRLMQMSADLEPIVLGEQRTWPTRWNKQQYQAAIVLAGGHLTRGEAGAKYATTMLSVAMRGVPTANNEQTSQMVVLSVIGWLVQNDEDRALMDLALIIPDRQQASSLIQTTAELLSKRNMTLYPAEAKRLLVTIEALQGERQISEQEEVNALRSAGRLTEAINKQRLMASNYPNSFEDQFTLAWLLSSSVEQKHHKEALVLWQQIETRSPAGDPTWHEARLTRIELLQRLDRIEEAKKLLKLSRLIAPVSEENDQIEKYNQLSKALSE